MTGEGHLSTGEGKLYFERISAAYDLTEENKNGDIAEIITGS